MTKIMEMKMMLMIMECIMQRMIQMT